MYPALGTVLSILLLLFPVESLCASGQQTEQITNSEITRMVKAGLPESVILEKIKTSSGQLDTSPDALIALKQAGASDGILSAVLKHSGQVGSSDGTGARASLEANLKSIQDSLNKYGTASYTLHFHDSKSGQNQELVETDRVQVDAEATTCRLSIEKTQEYGGKKEKLSMAANIKDADEVVVRPLEEDFRINDTAMGDTNYSNYRTEPPTFVVVLLRTGKTLQGIANLNDLTLANRVAESLANAARLCNGGDRNVKLTLGVINEALADQKTPPPDNAPNDSTLPPDDIDTNSSIPQPSTTGYNRTVVNINSGVAPMNPQKGGSGRSAAQAAGTGSTPRFTNTIPQCATTQYEPQNGALWIVNKCNVAVVVEWTSDSGNSWGTVNIQAGGRQTAGQSGIGYSRRDGRVYLYACPKDSTPVLPSGDPFIPRTYNGPYNCALP
jgi:hypothetical protein